MRVYTRKMKEKWVDGEKFLRGKKSVIREKEPPGKQAGWRGGTVGGGSVSRARSVMLLISTDALF